MWTEAEQRGQQTLEIKRKDQLKCKGDTGYNRRTVEIFKTEMVVER